MRVAALYDIHGNAHAAEAVLAEPEVAAADVVVVGGDCVAGAQPRETLELLLALGDRKRFIRGNADRYIVEAATSPADGSSFDLAAKWVAHELDAGQLAFLADLRLTVVLDVDGLGAVLFCHATPNDDEAIFTRVTPADRMAELLGDVPERVVVCGHTHVQFDRVVDGLRVVNAGSVGRPYEGRPGAFWTLLGPDVDQRRTDYNVGAAADAIRSSGLGEEGERALCSLLEPQSADDATELWERAAGGG